MAGYLPAAHGAVLGQLQHEEEEDTMHYDEHMDASDWLWMTPMMILWVALIGIAVYIAVRLATRPPGGGA